MNPEFPQSVRRVPDEDTAPKLDATSYEKPTIAQTIGKGLSEAEARHFEAMGMARTQADLAESMSAFNQVSTEKSASDLGMSLEDMVIDEQSMTLANGFPVVVSRSRRGVITFRSGAQ